MFHIILVPIFACGLSGRTTDTIALRAVDLKPAQDIYLYDL